MSACSGCDVLRAELKKLNEQLEAVQHSETQWREQWCKDGNEIAQLRKQIRDLECRPADTAIDVTGPCRR